MSEDSSQQIHNHVWGEDEVSLCVLMSHSIIFSSALHQLVWALLPLLPPSSGGLFIPQPSVFLPWVPVAAVGI